MVDAQVLNWGLTAAAGVLTIGRYAVRLFMTRKLSWDDAVHGVAFAALLIHGATNQITADAKAQVKHDNAKSSHVPSEQLLHEYQHLHVLSTVNNVFLYAVFWIVKFAFLLCYKQIFRTSKPFMRAWWAVVIFTFITYWIPFAGVVATCSGATTVADYQQCNSANTARAARLIYSCVLNIVTDLMIMALPLSMLPRLKINVQQKLGLAFIFSIAFFCIALDILRTTEALASHQSLYTVLEINFVVIVSCLPTYRSLLTLKRRQRELKASKGYVSWTADSKNRKQSTTLVSETEIAMKPVVQVESRQVADEESSLHASPRLTNHRNDLAQEPTDFTIYR